MATQLTFGSGKLFLKHPTTNQAYQVGVLEDVSINFEGSTKSKSGGQQFAIATVMTNKKVTGKASFAQIDGRLVSAIMSGTVTAGRIVQNDVMVTGTVTTVLPTGTAFDRDLGVIAADGTPLAFTTGTAAAGVSYSRTGNAYTFHASEPMSGTISYTYASNTGSTLAVQNQAQGTQTNFSMFLQEKDSDGDLLGFELFSVVIPNMNFAFKAEDFAAQDISFEAQANAAGAVYKVYLP
jgi:hypothetical protein